ncbi:MAG: hypothetical protein ACQEV7_13865 [Bacillota bacterium]
MSYLMERFFVVRSGGHFARHIMMMSFSTGWGAGFAHHNHDDELFELAGNKFCSS